MFRLVHVSTIAESLRAFRDQLIFMQEHGFEVHAVASESQYAQELETDSGIRVHRVDIQRPIAPRRDLVSLVRLVRLFRQLQPDIVHAHTPKGGLLGMWAARLARVPVRIYHVRGLRYVTEKSWRRAVLKQCERSACAAAHQVLSVSHSIRALAIADRLTTADRIVVLENGGHGVDALHRFNPDAWPADLRETTRRKWNIPTDACVIGFVGRMVADKGLRELWSAWRMLREDHSNLHLLLVGPRESEYPLPDDIAKSFDGDPRVHCTGADFNTPPLYAAMDIACLPSYREGLPKMPLEAAAMRLPVVTTDAPGCVDAIVPGITGMLVPVGDVGALRAALQVYAVNPALRHKHGKGGRLWVSSNFQPQRIHRAMLEQYTQLLHKAGRTTGDDQAKELTAAPQRRVA